MALTKRDRVLTITDDPQEAQKLRHYLAVAVVKVGVYVKAFRPADSRKWMYAVCAGRHFGP
jgi:hypothetical protein